MQIFLAIIASLALVYLIITFLVAPSSKKHSDLEKINKKFIAHRGLHDEKLPENSIASFLAAVDKKLPIEIDLHLSKDGEVIVFHDANLKRMCGTDVKIADLSLHEIKKFKLLETEESIPTLTECLDAVNGKVPLLIEFKMENNNTKELCSAANKILSEYKGVYLIQSFYPQILRWYKKHNKKICRGQLACVSKKKGFSKWLAGNLLLNFIGRPHFVSYRHSDANNPMFKFSVWLGAFPIGWTFQSKKALKQNKKYFNTWIFELFTPNEEN